MEYSSLFPDLMSDDEATQHMRQKDLELRIKAMSDELSILNVELKALKAKIYLRNTQKK